jgi:hypothetical protein
MQTQKTAAKPVAKPAQAAAATMHDIGKLAAFIQHHHHTKAPPKAVDHPMVEIKGGDHDVAKHLGLTTEVLAHSYASLIKDLIVRRHGRTPR